jgi:hypothetical protein
MSETMEKEIERLNRELEEARDVPWPAWAESIFATLKKHGYDPDDGSGQIDLAEAFSEYLEGVAAAEAADRRLLHSVKEIEVDGSFVGLHFTTEDEARLFQLKFAANVVNRVPREQKAVVKHTELQPVGITKSMIAEGSPLMRALVSEFERARRQWDEYQKTGISTAAHGAYDLCFGVILDQHLGKFAMEPPVRWQRRSPGTTGGTWNISADGWVDVPEEDIEGYKNRGQEIRALYVAPYEKPQPEIIAE